MSNVEHTLRIIRQRRYIIKTDLCHAYYQISLAKQSMKHCGVCTPFKQIRVYWRCAMGMRGPEVALEELLNRLLGELVQAGVVTKVTYELYCGPSAVEKLCYVWEKVLTALSNAGMKLSPAKTICCPRWWCRPLRQFVLVKRPPSRSIQSSSQHADQLETRSAAPTGSSQRDIGLVYCVCVGM